MRAAIRSLISRLATGSLDSRSFDVPGLKLARRAGLVESRRVGPPTALYRTDRRRRQPDFTGLAWRHELTAVGRAALAEAT